MLEITVKYKRVKFTWKKNIFILLTICSDLNLADEDGADEEAVASGS